MAHHPPNIDALSNFFSFTKHDLPTMKPPASNTNGAHSSGQVNLSKDNPTIEVKVETHGYDYVQEFVEAERKLIEEINLGEDGHRRHSSRQYHHRGGRRGGRMSRGRGRSFGSRSEEHDSLGNEQRPAPRFERQPEASVYGSIADNRVSDADVYLKYDFASRRHDTSKLVINKLRGRILSLLNNHQVMTIEGFTGCGKTTQVPQFILNEAASNSVGCRIAVTQPRRIAAISVANRVAAERGWKTGEIVGYQVGMDKTVSPDTRLTYMTTGVLLQLLIARKSLNEWTHIIIDEVHERDLETDLLLLVIKKIMLDTRNKRTRIILMSATLDSPKFSKYFPQWKMDNLAGTACNVILDVPRQHAIQEYYLEDAANKTGCPCPCGLNGYENFNLEGIDEPKLHQECCEITSKLIEGFDANESGPSNVGSVLVFLPGLMEIETLYKVLSELGGMRAVSEDPSVLKWVVLPLHSSITNEEQQRVFISPQRGYRKIILATNIAESSITVPDIKYVIDFCLTKNLSCDPATNYTCLRLEWASKNQCIQRRGRCGRVGPGVVYKMVTKKFYDTLQQEAKPEMLRSSLECVVLQAKLLKMGSPKAILAAAVDPPSESNIGRAVANLKEIGALTIEMNGAPYDAYDGELTYVGLVLSRLPIDIKLGRLILLGHAFGCLEETVIIAAGLSVKSPFAYPYSKRLEAYLSKLKWSEKSFSDCVALLNLYQKWHSEHDKGNFIGWREEKAWARIFFAQVTSLREMKVVIGELYKRLQMCGITPQRTTRTEGYEQRLLIKLVIAGAFYPNYFNRTRPNARDYQKEISREVAGNDPFNSVVFYGFPNEQPGDLYKMGFAKALSYQNCIPKVIFHGSKAVVTFDSRGSYHGCISAAVYRAVKMRQLRLNLSFSMPTRETARNLVEEGKLSLETVKIQPSPPPAPMPLLRTTRIEAIVIQCDSPSELFIIRRSDEAVHKQISNHLHGNRHTLTQMASELCEPGQFCIVNVDRAVYYRARIDAVRNNFEEVLVYLIDRGSTIWLNQRFIYNLSEELLKLKLHEIPALAIQCQLSEVRAAARTGCTWCPEAKAVLQEFCSANRNQVFVEIYSILDCVIFGVVTNSASSDSPSINDILVEKKFADRCQESQRSKDNHSVRNKIKFDSRRDDAPLYREWEEIQNNYIIPERLIKPPANVDAETLNHVTLRGPHNPLEMSFTSLCRSAHLKQVMTEGSSINSIVLDQNPNDPSSQLMISASVSIAARSGNIMARETTIMPSTPGLCGLLAMMFCPKLEFRTDENNSMYTGCVTGLGVDPVNNCSVYPDHDMEIVFDTVIDNEDISLVNSIRSALNVILSEDHHDMRDGFTTNYGISSLISQMRSEAIRLIERDRRFVEEIWPEETHQWNQINPSILYEAKKERDISVVFPLHNHVRLNTNQNTERQGPPGNRNAFSYP